MKDFLKHVLATVTGLIITGLIILFLGVIMLFAVAMSSSAPSVEDKTVMVIKLDGALTERAESNVFSDVLYGKSSSLSLEDMLSAIALAKDNDKVKGIYLEAGMMTDATPAMLQELRDALTDFKSSGKFVLSYGDTYTQGAYYVCSVADSVVVNPYGMLEWRGMSMQTVFFKDLLDKLGVEMQIFKVGTYKSAVEPFIGNEMSEANREQVSVFSNEVWDEMLADVSESRKITPEALDLLSDTVTSLCEPNLYVEKGLVDKLAYSDEVPDMICGMMGVEEPSDYNVMDYKDMACVASNQPKDDSGDIVAVYYAYGDIVDVPSPGMGANEIVSSKVIRDLEDLADDDDVKAVVLRVNSGGGSAYASEQIWHQVMNIKSKKPIVVSMGGMAASGGYYISCGANWIVAEPTTLTGSIGIFGIVPEVSDLVNNKLGVHFETVATNKYSDFGDLSRPMSEPEKNVMQTYVNRGYELFTKRCADGRNMLQDSIKSIAEGRVWTGIHAKELGLVDQLGGLDDAIAEAKRLAEIESCTVMSYPGKPSYMDMFFQSIEGDSYADAKIHEVMGDYYNVFAYLKRISSERVVVAKTPYLFKFGL